MSHDASDPLYPPDYPTARLRFREAARMAGAELEQIPIGATGPAGESLTIDVALVARRDPQAAVVVSSGVHGAEGFFGSAIQANWLTGLARAASSPPDVRLVFIHAVNPYGFSWLRRVNEDNIDLNRNFLSPSESFAGSPPGYAALDGLLNPTTPPTRWEPFTLKMLVQRLRPGWHSRREAVVRGQHDYPRGLFFAGQRAAQSTRIVQQEFPRWLGGAGDVVHIDFHSGLGRFARYKLLLVEPGDSPRLPWYQRHFGATHCETLGDPAGVAYAARGVMGAWLGENLGDRNYRFLAPEFGTHSLLRVLAALRAENRAHFYSDPASRAYRAAKRELLECFCPASGAWRRAVVEKGVQIIHEACSAATSIDD